MFASRPKKSIHFLLSLVLFTAANVILQAQDVTSVISDTAAKQPEVIPVADISVRSGEVVVKTKKLLESLIPDEEITRLKTENDSLIGILDSLLKAERNIDLESKNIRYLKNKEGFWRVVNAMIEKEKSKLSNIVRDLDEKKYKLEDEKAIWKNTGEKLKDEDPGSSVFTRIEDLILRLDSVRNVIQGKNTQMLEILDRTTSKGLVVNDLIDKFVDVTERKQGSLFVANLPPIWKTDFSRSGNWAISGPIQQFKQMEVKGLIRYLQNHMSNNYFLIFLLILLIISFRIIKIRLKNAEVNNASFYTSMLVRIMSHPVSAALILGMFASILVYPNNPLLLRDLTKIIIAIPLILIVVAITNRVYHKYFYIIGVLMLIQMVYYIFPPGHLFYLISMLTASLIIFWALLDFFRYIKAHPISPRSFNRFISFITVLHIAIAAVSIMSIAVGASMLAEVCINLIIMNAFGGMLLVISAIIINGLIEVGIDSPGFRKLNIFKNYGWFIKKRAIRLVNLGGFLIWLFAAFRVIRIERQVTDGIAAFLTEEINVGSASFTFGGIVVFFLVIWLSIVIANMIRAILEEDVLNNVNLAKGVPHTISVMVRYTIITIGLLLAVSAAGMPLDSLTILFGAFGVGIGFGLQNIFNNLVSGLILLFERPIQIGDTIEVGQLMGNVKSIGIRSSNVRTFDGAEVIVPNGQLISNEVINWTLSDQTRRIEVIAGVAYGSDPHKVKSLFVKILTEHPDILQDPPPSVFFQELGDSSLNFRLLFWTAHFGEWVRIRSDIIFRVHDILKEEGIEIPFPQRDLHLRSVDQHIEIIRKDKKE